MGKFVDGEVARGVEICFTIMLHLHDIVTKMQWPYVNLPSEIITLRIIPLFIDARQTFCQSHKVSHPLATAS